MIKCCPFSLGLILHLSASSTVPRRHVTCQSQHTGRALPGRKEYLYLNAASAFAPPLNFLHGYSGWIQRLLALSIGKGPLAASRCASGLSGGPLRPNGEQRHEFLPCTP